jgi:hypothetical protein
MLRFYKTDYEWKVKYNWWHIFYTHDIYGEHEENSAYCLKSTKRAGKCLVNACILPLAELAGGFYRDNATIYMHAEEPVWYK